MASNPNPQQSKIPGRGKIPVRDAYESSSDSDDDMFRKMVLNGSVVVSPALYRRYGMDIPRTVPDSSESSSDDEETKILRKSMENSFEISQKSTPDRLPDLPREIQHKILKHLPKTVVKTARFVCKDWNVVCSKKKLEFKTPPLNDETFPMLQKTTFKFNELTVTELTGDYSVQHTEFGNGLQVRVLKLKNTRISVENLEWLFKECENVEKMQIIQCNSKESGNESLISNVFTCARHCPNLQVLEINTWFTDDEFSQKLVLDCENLSSCKKLKHLSVYSWNPLELLNPATLLPSIKMVHVILLSMEITEFPEFTETSIHPLATQIPPELVTYGFQFQYVNDDDDNNDAIRTWLTRVLPYTEKAIFTPGSAPAMLLLIQTIRKFLDVIGPESLLSVCTMSSLLNFVLDFNNICLPFVSRCYLNNSVPDD